MGRRFSSILVICPRCGGIGSLYYHPRIGWHVKHGARVTHSVKENQALEVPLHDPKLNLIFYMGGDSFLLPYLAKMIPPHECYVEVFGGGAPLLLNKPPSKFEVYNDLDGDLVNLFMVVRDRPEEFLKRTEWLLVSRQLYYDFLSKLRSKEIKDPIERAVIYWYVAVTSFAGKFGKGLGFGPKSPIASKMWGVWERLRLIHERLKRVIIEQLDFRELIKRYDRPTTFFYLDPPHLYYGTEGSDYYTLVFSDKDYMDLLDIITKIKGKFLLKQSGEIPWLLEWAEKHGYTVKRVELFKYSQKKVGEKRERYIVYFISNYELQ